MSDVDPLDLSGFRAWIGRTDTAFDVVTPRLVEALRATLNSDAGDFETASDLPPTLHWCLAPPAAKTSSLGDDGHPARGDFLPPVPLARRMWAGGHVEFQGDLHVGDRVERRSRIVDVTVKQGRSGPLCFVAVEHEIITPRGTAIRERQDIVYSDIVKPTAGPGNAAKPDALPAAQWQHESQASPVLLFRYSALTFNGHRIHYDRPYATEIEHYPGLLVHGPLQATLLIEFGARIKGKAPRGFKFRGVKPLFDFMAFRLCADETKNGLHLWIQGEDGTQTMVMEAFW